MMVIDLPTHVPRKPDGTLNFEQLAKEFWLGANKHFGEPARYFGEYVEALVTQEFERYGQYLPQYYTADGHPV